MNVKLATLLAGMVAGCCGLADVEALTGQLSPAARRKLRIWRRVPDTTLRELVMRFAGALDRLRHLLHRQTRVAHRRKQLAPEGLPCGVVAIDGKHVATKKPDEIYAQQQGDGWVVRSLTATLTSGEAAVYVDAWPIPKEQTNNALVLHRDVSRRGEHKRAIPWKRLLEWLRTTLTAATVHHLNGLRWPPPPSGYGRPPPWATEAMA